MIKVLYVDDEPDLLTLGRIFLEREGDFTVTTAPGAAEAIDLLKDHSFDVIISDYQMPKMDGITFLKELKAEGIRLRSSSSPGEAGKKWSSRR